jgi:hypothetical protein
MMTKSQTTKKPSPEGKEPRGLSDAQRDQIRELFENIYVTKKWQMIGLNFLRGIAFGLGTFLGGTIVIAIVIWILAQTIDVFPWAHDFTQKLINSLSKS